MVATVNNNLSLAAASGRPPPQPAAAATGRTGNDVPASGKDLPPAPAVDLAQMVEQINHFMASNSRNLHFRFDDVTNQSVITVVNPSSGEVIRQIPSEEALRLAAMIKDMASANGASGLGGLHLFDQLV
ncbi:MAG: flagellar protein FlaG [Gammaproteobacteria bacterium]|jgi:flagellar protein FlaG